MTRIAIFYILLTTLFLGCQKHGAEISSNPYFQERFGSELGIDFSNNLHFNPELNIIEYLYYYNGGGVAIGDINNDGLEDVFLGANQLPDRIYLNKGNLQFEDVTEQSGINMDSSWTTGISMDDINGDGFIDIYVCKSGVLGEETAHNELYINKGDGTFEERSEEYGLAFVGYATHASFFDYDLDGDLDMYLLNHSTHSVRSYGEISKRLVKDSLSGDRLYEHILYEGASKFIDVTEQAGIYNSALGYGLSVITSDINNDGWIDIYVGNDFHENDYLYLNNGDKTFTESIASTFHHTSQFSMGSDIADMNNDGAVDLFTTDMMPWDAKLLLKSGGEDTDQIAQIKKDFGFENQYARNHFHLNNGDNTFSEIALLTDTYATDWSWSVLLQDYNNDGTNDIFITNGIVKRPNDLDYINYINQASLENIDESQKEEIYKEVIEKMPTLKIPNVLFINDDSNKFQSYEKSLIGQPSYSNGVAYADLDLDGDLDIIVNNINEEASILENKSSENANYISFDFHTANGKPTTKGTKVILYADGVPRHKEYTTTRGFQSSSTHIVHFGLGAIQTVDSIIIIWPGNIKEVLRGLEVNMLHTIMQKENIKSPYKNLKEGGDKYALQIFPFKHKENDFEDFNEEKLIPERLSREGPALEINDFNGDGRMDVFLGSTVYNEPILYLAQLNGSFSPKKIPDFRSDAIYEDVDATSFDFDNDGDLDLYVVSGGSDKSELDERLQDRLYLNDGKANFKRHKVSLPHTNGSVVSAGDYNQDGFIDLFVGARSIPGAYGLSPYSFILKNVEGQYFDIGFKERFGMVTDGQWVDINNDQLLDLVIVGDWMPIVVYTNTGDDDFINYTGMIGLSNSNGLWNTVEFVDLNQDGRLDILAGNAGENFKWKATDSLPISLYLNDYDKNGKVDPLIFYNYFGEYIPFATKDQIAGSLPFIKKKYSNYEDFSKVRSIEELTDIGEEDMIEIKYVKELRSMMYINRAAGFEGYPLPVEAQISSIQDFQIIKEDSDKLKVLFVGNYNDYTKNLGASSSNTGGALYNFNAQISQFESYDPLPLPFNLNPKSIKQFGDNTFLIAVNNDVQYILTAK